MKNKTRMNKLTAWLLTFAMLTALIPAFTISANAEKTKDVTERNIFLGTDHIIGAQKSNIWYGRYPQSSLGSTQPTAGTEGVDWIKNDTATQNEQGPYYKIEPVKWRVLEKAGKYVFLLSDKNLDLVQYNQQYTDITWKKSTIRSWLNGSSANENNCKIDYTNDNFVSETFSPEENAHIPYLPIANHNNPSYDTPSGNVDTWDKVFVLSCEEVKNTDYGFTHDSMRVALNTDFVRGGGNTGAKITIKTNNAWRWWMRTAGYYRNYAAYVDYDGYEDKFGCEVDERSIAIRPAFKLDITSVLFTSCMDEGHTLTFKDDSRSFSGEAEDKKTLDFGEKISFAYSNAVAGDNEYISAVLVNADNEVVNYAQLTKVNSESGTVQYTVPKDIERGDYTLKFFNEQYNGEQAMNLSSDFVNVPVHIHYGGFATCSKLALCDVCHVEYGDLAPDVHAPATEWTFENGKHYHKCLYDCDAHLEEAECYGGTATCLNMAVCDACGYEYGAINPENHALTDTYYKKVDETSHTEYYSCCNAPKDTSEHIPTVAATCSNVAYCSVCMSPYGNEDESQHAGEFEWIVENNSSHSKKWLCCGVYELRYEAHKLEYSVDEDNNTISAYCTDCGAEGFVKMVMAGGVYNGYAFTATAEKNGIFNGRAPAYPEFTYCCEDGCKTAGAHTATMTLGEKTISKEFHIDKKPLDFQYIRCHTKQYDGTRNVTITGMKLNGVVIYSKGADGFAEYDDVKDDVSLSWATLTALLPDSAIGYYETADVSGIALEGADKDNYTISESISGVTLQDNYGWDYSVDYIPLTIELKDQIIYGEGELEQDAYTISLDDRFEISGIVLYDDGYGKVDADTSNLKVTHNGEDWTEYVSCTVYTANLLRVCDGHITDENGFCSTGNCDAYDIPELITETDEYDNEISFYQIENAGQLYWFAEQVNVYYNTSINARLVNSIYVNKDLTVENLRDWTPIGGRYSSYTGMFDGNGYSVSGLYFNNPDADYVGLFGSTDYGYTIKNIHIKNSYFNGNNCVGALCGYAGSNISYCTASADVTVNGNSDVGGLVGSSSYGELKNCYSLAAVDSDGLVGGLVGRNCLAISNCYTNQNSIYGYNNSSYGGSVENSYYLSSEETEDGGKTAVQFENGEVAYLLQSGIVGEPIYDDEWNEIGTTEPELVWGQFIGTDYYPVFGGAKVYLSNGIYHNEVKEFGILSNGTDGNKATATIAIPTSGTFTLIFADYEETRLNNMDFVTVTTESDNTVVNVPCEIDITLGTDDKIMLWQDMTNLVPLCDAYIVK